MRPFSKRLTDPETGQEYAVIVAPVQPRMGKWVRLFQDGKLRLMRQHPEVRGQAYQVLAYLEATSTWTNAVPSAALTAQRMGLNRVSVARCYAALLAAEFVLKRDGIYYISPFVAWKGNERQYNAFCRELFDAHQEAQPLEMPSSLLSLLRALAGRR